MTSYRLPRRYRYRAASKTPSWLPVALVVAAVALAGGGGGAAAKAAASSEAHADHLAHAAHVADSGGGATAVTVADVSGARAKALAYANAQIGKWYQWGATGPATYDCSGLVMRAWQAAGVSLARTSQLQWATGAHVFSLEPGDLIYYAGADGTPAAPGHVTIYDGNGRMTEAYATGWRLREVPVRPGYVGFTDPTRSA